MMVYRGDIVYIKKFKTYGSEQDSGRPAVVVSNDKNNQFSDAIEIVYLKSQEKKDLPTHCQVLCKTPSTALCEQVTTVSIERVGDFIRTATAEEMKQIEKCMMISLGIDKPVQDVKTLGEVMSKPVVEEPFFTISDEDRIRLETERDTYKKMYEDLLGRMVK